jgi:hypothetical protein
MSRSQTHGARRPASTRPDLQKKMRKNSVLKNLTSKGGPSSSPAKQNSADDHSLESQAGRSRNSFNRKEKS